MSILKIAKLGHPVLYKKATPVKNIKDPRVEKLIYDMTETMLDAKGIGLAAPQVHVSKQIIIFDPSAGNEEKKDQLEITQSIDNGEEASLRWDNCHKS